MKKILVICAGALIFIPVFCKAQIISRGDVVINEIAWMGSTQSGNNEWMELKNATDEIINLSEWMLKSSNGKIAIPLQNVIYPNGFYLLERTNDDSVPNITADAIYKGSLNNNGEDLTLYDSSGNIIDEVDFPAKWPAGNNTTKQTMERTADGSWQTSQNPNGTPKAENSIGAPQAATTVKSGTDSAATGNPLPIITYPGGIVINEILPNPKGTDATDEWIELYNSNNAPIDLSGWKLQDLQGMTTTYAFPQNTTMAGNGYLVVKRPDTKIILDNGGDGLDLLAPDSSIQDSVSYADAPLNESYNKTTSGWQWSNTLTPGAANIIVANVTAIKQTTLMATALPKTKKTDSTYVAAVSAAVNPNESVVPNQSARQTTANPLLLFFTILGAIIILAAAAIIINIKLNLFKNHERP